MPDSADFILINMAETRGRPVIYIDEEQVNGLKTIGLKWKQIADLIGVSERELLVVIYHSVILAPVSRLKLRSPPYGILRSALKTLSLLT